MWGPISQFTLFAALKCLAQESVRAPNFVHSCCFDSMAASFEQGRQDVLGAPVWMCNVLDKWGERHWAEYGAEVAASLEQAYQSQDDKPVQFSWTAPTAPQVVIMDGEPEAATGRAPATKAAHVDKGPMLYKALCWKATKRTRTPKLAEPCKGSAHARCRSSRLSKFRFRFVLCPAMLAQFDQSQCTHAR